MQRVLHIPGLVRSFGCAQGCHLQFRRILVGDDRSAAGQDRRYHRPEVNVEPRLLNVREAIEQRTSRHGCPRLGTASSIHDDVHLGQDPDFGSRAPHVTTQP